jgi:hypothetical protein
MISRARQIMICIKKILDTLCFIYHVVIYMMLLSIDWHYRMVNIKNYLFHLV